MEACDEALLPVLHSQKLHRAGTQQSDQLALGGGQVPGSTSAGGGGVVPLSGFSHLPSGRRCRVSHPGDCANRPGRTAAAGASRGRGELHAGSRPRSRSPCSPLPAPSAKMAARRRAQPFRFLPGWQRAPAPAGARAAGSVNPGLGVNVVSCPSGWGSFCVRNSTEAESRRNLSISACGRC